ncbi:hypothetical protein EMCRGX_G015774 [Ephydatia muelleri]
MQLRMEYITATDFNFKRRRNTSPLYHETFVQMVQEKSPVWGCKGWQRIIRHCSWSKLCVLLQVLHLVTHSKCESWASCQASLVSVAMALQQNPVETVSNGTGGVFISDGKEGLTNTNKQYENKTPGGKKKKTKKKKKAKDNQPTDGFSSNRGISEPSLVEDGSTLPSDHGDGCAGASDSCSILEQKNTETSKPVAGQCNQHQLPKGSPAEPLKDSSTRLDSSSGSNCTENGLTKPVVESSSTSLESSVAQLSLADYPVQPDTKESCENTTSKGRWALNQNGCAGAESFGVSRKGKRKAQNVSKQRAQNEHLLNSSGLVQANVQDKYVNNTTEQHLGDQSTSGIHASNKKDTENEISSCKKPHIDKKWKRNKKKQNKNVPKKCEEKLQGLVNSGSTCYMNAALQLLCSADTFREFKLEHDLPDKENKHFVHQFICLMNQMREKQTHPLDASSIKHEVGKTVHRFSDSSEQDSQEFLTVLLERMHNLLKAKPDLPATSSPDPNHAVSSPDKEFNPAASSPDKEKIRVQAKESWSHHLEQGHSLVVELFQGQLVSTLECDACKHVLVKFDTFMFLPITVPSRKSAVSLDECLRLYTNEDIIDGWPCSVYRGEVKVKRRVLLWKTPPFLMLYLKRYKLDKTGERHKVCTHVDFPLSGLDLSSSHMETPKGEEALYNLCAVINHYSSDHNSRGHYTTVSRCGEQWFYFDDDKVHLCSESDIVTPAAYVLLYKRNECRTESKELPHSTEVEGSRLQL